MRLTWLTPLILLACAQAPAVTEYRLDPWEKSWDMLRAPNPKGDRHATDCLWEPCYVYFDADIRAIKKYIVSLEERLKKCEAGDG